MIRNYFKIAWRNIRKSKQQSVINLLGLTVGTVSCLVILLYVFSQTGYDSHHDNAENIYRVRTIIDSENNDYNTAAGSPPIAFAMKEDFPEVTEATRIVSLDENGISPLRVSNSPNGYYERRGYLADSTVFKIFKFKFIEGGLTTALNAPSTMVLSSTLATKLFGSNKAINETIEVGSGGDLVSMTVTGVFDDTYGKSHLNPNYFISMNSPGLGNWVRGKTNFRKQNFVYSYVSCVPNTNAVLLESKLPDFLESHGGEEVADKTLFLQKVTDINLYSKGIKFQIDKVSSIEYLYFLLTLAFFIQFVACINFINLSTARASKRAKEIGVRKVVGAAKGSLVRQFLGESLMLSFFTMLISIPITLLLLPYVNGITEGSLSYLDVFNWKIGALLTGLGLFTGLVSGIYPAVVLSSIKPVEVLKSTINLQSGSVNLRKALVVFQFVISIGLVASVIIITKQFNYTQNKDLGFEKENLLAIRMGGGISTESYTALKSQFLELSGVSGVAGLGYAPSERVLDDYTVYTAGKTAEEGMNVQNNGISEDYFKTMDITLLSGREFRDGDQNQVVVNEALLKGLNINPDIAIGETLFILDGGDQTREFQIVGVVSDFHFASLKDAIGPLLLYKSSRLNWIVLRTESTNHQQLLQQLEQRWKTTVPNVPFDYVYMDQEMEKMYAEEKRLGNISIIFTIIAIFISCLGLFGLISYVAEQKKKEIGIRKVLGASVSSIVELLTKDFVKLVLVAFIIASPIAYFFMNRWLEGFTYKINIDWWVFVLAGGFALLITLLTVGFQSAKAAIANPVKSLRTE